jgi:predicted CXXCH cytochrome family protein
VICTDCHGAHDVITGAQWQEGEGVDACVACHEERGVELANAAALTRVVQGGLFAEQTDNEYCLSCHSLPNLSMTLDSGEKVFLTVDEERFHDSVHGTSNPVGVLRCTDCHEGYRYPHEPVIASTVREYTLDMYTLCARCHEPKYEEVVDSVHGEKLAAGVEEAAVCTDCHGNHYIPVPDEPRSRISYTCRQCHSTIFDEYRQSVHGEALLDEGNPDVAVCTDCHGVHSITDPTQASFRLSSPEICAKCHADDELMAKYDISTDVFETYVADFHGTTVTLFEIQDPEAATNKAVCFDCHGVHDIRPPDDPDSGIKQRLLETCRQCHPNASANFPDAWTSHFVPSLEHHPTVFLVNLFYKIVIPGTVAFFGFLVLTDVYRRLRRR